VNAVHPPTYQHVQRATYDDARATCDGTQSQAPVLVASQCHETPSQAPVTKPRSRTRNQLV